jgi:hypothetical protein
MGLYHGQDARRSQISSVSLRKRWNINFMALNKIDRFFIPHRKHISPPIRTQQVNAVYRFLRKYIDITIAVLDSIRHPDLYLKHTMDNVRTSQEAH